MPGDILADKEALELVRSYYAIPENQRRRLFDLARVLSERRLTGGHDLTGRLPRRATARWRAARRGAADARTTPSA